MKNIKAVNALRVLSCDMINEANSGHPGICLGAAPILYSIFNKNFKGYPSDGNWYKRDRFIMSAGHGSALLYANLHFLGYNISLEDLKEFRQINSKTPGHPEYLHTDGIEATTGPLGQGIAMAVGLAISYKNLQATFNTKNYKLFDNKIYSLCGDGDLQEGISYEAIALAGHLKLNNLIVLYDSNDVQLDGDTKLASSENIKKRFESNSWNYIKVLEGNNISKIKEAISAAKLSKKPTLIEVKTKIGFSASSEGTSKVHGSPLGADIENVRKNLDFNFKPFEIPQEVYETFKEMYVDFNQKQYEESKTELQNYAKDNPELFKKLQKYESGKVEFDVNKIKAILQEHKNIASRQSSGIILKEITKNSNLMGGSADLSASTKALANDASFSSQDYKGRNLNFGVREHAMGAIANGIALSGYYRPFISGFFVFSDYLKPAIRMAALMNLNVLYVFTHDSVYVGEDGPTHQPIEQIVGLTAIPNVDLFRPADTNEVIASYKAALENNKPSILVLTRQNLKDLPNSSKALDENFQGAYVYEKEDKNKPLDLILLGTGSELDLLIEASKKIADKNIRIVSMPSFTVFDKLSQAAKLKILPQGVKVIACEASNALHLYKYADEVFKIEQFGYSGPSSKVLEKLRFNLKNLVVFIKKNIN